MGTMFVAVQNTTIPLGTALGELWVTYDVEFAIPLISPARFGYFQADWAGGAVTTLNSPYTTAALQPLTVYGDMTGATIVSNSTTAYLTMPNLQLGDIVELTAWVFNSGGLANATTSIGTRFSGANNCVVVLDGNGFATNTSAPNSIGSLSNYHSATCTVRITGVNPNITVTSPAFTSANVLNARLTASVLFGSGATL